MLEPSACSAARSAQLKERRPTPSSTSDSRPAIGADPRSISGPTPICTPPGGSIRSASADRRARTRFCSDYRALLARSRLNQLRFNAALLLGALVIVGLAIFAALRLADRLVRPVGQLAAAAGRIEQGDFSTRVPVTRTEDEIQTLAAAFNRMTERLDEQTGALQGRQRPARNPPRLHRGGAVQRHRRRGRARFGQPRAADQPLGGDPAAARRGSDRRRRAGRACRPSSTSSCTARSARPTSPSIRAERAADPRGQARALRRRRGAHLRRHHRPAQRPAQRRLVRHRAAHRP